MPTNYNKKGLTAFPTVPVGETQLHIENNQISKIPSSISTLVNLNRFYLRNNKIIEIPPEIGNLKNLQILLMSNNLITKLPKEIGNLENLIQLRINNNKLTELPKEIGQLTKLTHLYLDNNQLSTLPEEIKYLTNLVHFSINENQIKLPNSYSANTPQNTINLILEQQSELFTTDSTIITKAYYFTNGSKDNIVKLYDSIMISLSSKINVEFINIDSASRINTDTNIVFIVAPFDSHDNDRLIFDIAKSCKSYQIRFFILVQDKFLETEFESANLIKWHTFNSTKNRLLNKYPSECKTYSSYDEFNNLITAAIKRHKPKITLAKLTLENIGHFSNLEITFDKDITCLIGENGTGKSTILRALALAIIGPDHKKIEEKIKKEFLRIIQFENNNIIYANGIIRLEYFIDGDKFINQLNLISTDNGNDISIVQTGDSNIVFNKYNLKSLIIGFPQSRGGESSDNSDFIHNIIAQPHISDLLPLINNSDDHRLRSFSGWIANLYFNSIKNQEKNSENKKDEFLIEKAFEIISKITKKEIKFKTVTKIDPPDVWVSTYDSPNGVPLNLISQGFKIVIGWMGYLLNRFVNTFPLSDPSSSFKENAIVILDEVDISMHPIWQLSFLEILKEIFPRTQFIITTHDPLVIGSLMKEQVRILQEMKGTIKVIQPETDPKGLGVAGILTSELFGLSTTLDEETSSVLDRRNALLLKQDKDKLSSEEIIELNQIFQYLNSLGINTTDRDPLFQKFIVAISERDDFKKETYSVEELKKQNSIALETLTELLNEKSKKK